LQYRYQFFIAKLVVVFDVQNGQGFSGNIKPRRGNLFVPALHKEDYIGPINQLLTDPDAGFIARASGTCLVRWMTLE
jgi:hypothetical protein